MIKNTAGQVVGAQMVAAADGTAFTGTVTVYITKDGGTQAIGTTSSGVCVHEGNGFHSYVPTQTETDADHVAFTFIGTGAIPQTVQIYTRAASPDVNVATVDSAAANTIRDAIRDLAMAEPTAVPDVTATLQDAVSWLLALSRNKITQTATTQTLRNDADDTDIATSAHSTDGTTFTRGEWS